MEPTGHKGPFATSSSEEHHTVLLPGNRVGSSSEAPPAVSTSSQEIHDPEQQWKPKFNRQQSWSEEDKKHELQRWLLSVEHGKETGFTETSADS